MTEANRPPTSPERMRHEYVPGKEITLAHLIAHPDDEMCEKLGIRNRGALGILTFTPVVSVIVASDIGRKAADVEIGFIDRFTGGPVGLDTIAAAIGEEPSTVETVIEPFLIKEGFLARTPRGRVATHRAYEVLERDMPRQPSLL